MTLKKNILVVDDEENISSAIKLNLEIENHLVTVSENGKLALDLIKTHVYDLIILDVMLPEMDGFTLCKKIKKWNPEVPVLFLTAKGSSMDKIEGLKLGADDYLSKPFNLEELLLRTQILLKRYAAKPGSILFEFKDYSINFSTFQVKGIGGRIDTLSYREIQLLKILTDKKNEVVSRDEILSRLWSSDENPSSRTIDNYILNFRKLFEVNPKEPQYFHSIRGVGYKFTG
jgi:two-component system alkaline phosphatase synthesis response regulator PhoP